LHASARDFPRLLHLLMEGPETAFPDTAPSREEALVFAARTLLWSLRMPLRKKLLPVFAVAAALLLEEALERYEGGAAEEAAD